VKCPVPQDLLNYPVMMESSRDFFECFSFVAPLNAEVMAVGEVEKVQADYCSRLSFVSLLISSFEVVVSLKNYSINPGRANLSDL
jgi:hypothetical protein